MNKSTFAERLQKARLDKGWTQTQLAEEANTTQNTISGYESDKTPNLDSAVNLAKALNVSLDWLTGLEAAPTPVKDVSGGDFLASLIGLLEHPKQVQSERTNEDDEVRSITVPAITLGEKSEEPNGMQGFCLEVNGLDAVALYDKFQQIQAAIEVLKEANISDELIKQTHASMLQSIVTDYGTLFDKEMEG